MILASHPEGVMMEGKPWIPKGLDDGFPLPKPYPWVGIHFFFFFLSGRRHEGEAGGSFLHSVSGMARTLHRN